MKVAIGMAAYNAERYIGDAITSLLRQRDAALLDIIVVDDGSTDRTAEVVAGIGASQVRLIRQQNQGVTRTRNVIVDALADDTDFVTSLDADDLFPESRITEDLNLFFADPSLEMSYGSAEVFRETDASGLRPSGRTMSVRGVQLGCGTFRYKLIRDVGRFDERFRQAEDMDFMLRLFEMKPKSVISDDIKYYYRRHTTNMTHDTLTLRRDFARALLYSAKRRKELGLGPLPDGIFDAKNFAAGIDW